MTGRVLAWQFDHQIRLLWVQVRYPDGREGQVFFRPPLLLWRRERQVSDGE